MTSVAAPAGGAQGKQARSRSSTIIYVSTGTVLSILFLLPLVWAVLRSFMQPSDITAAPSARAFGHLTVANYSGLITGSIHILRYVGNSVLVAGGTAVLTAVLATLAGYGLGRTRFRFRGSNVVFALILVTLMVPFQAILTPLFLELSFLHLLDNWLGLILFYSTFNLPFGVFVMRNSFMAAPSELEEAAYCEGAKVLTTLRTVLLPLVMPGVATTMLYAFLFAWTEFLGALTFITSINRLTLPVALLNVETGTFGQVNYGFLIAGAVIAMVPCAVLYVALQRFYVTGITAGGVKG
ncbi:MAG: carbohydrate ABC transporter permease [Streptosporangiaceae bacterium]|nr:carbohydrate ABC transporter permease [Streptosporangiaceae bacterium]